MTLTAVAATVANTTSASASSTIKVGMVPKILGMPVFEANVTGANEVAPSLGISLKATAPATASAEGQVEIFDSMILEHYNVICLSADDPTVPAPTLERAMKDGIKVISWDSDVIPAARDFFIQDTGYNLIAQAVISAAVKFGGKDVQVAIMSSTPDATIQLSWISAMRTYIKTTYPGVKILTIGYGQSNEATSLTAATDIIDAYPNVKVILPIDGGAIVGTAQAVSRLHDAGKIGIIGIGDPLPLRAYFKDGSVQAMFAWNEFNQGKLLMYVAKLAYQNKIHAGSTFTAGSLGTFTVTATANKVTGATKNTIIFSKPLEFTKSNYMQYDF
jgi:AI-2 transport system substrate-binding protein/rhamnose transport system substrate-binding protein